MGFRVITGDITKVSCDIILNSVGVDSKTYGGICKSIVKASGSKDLDDVLKRINDAYELGEYFVSEGFELPAKYIYHLICPFSKNDPEQKQYKESLRNFFNYCNKHELYDVYVPSFGTGANGYNKDVIRDIIREMSLAYASYYPYMDITLVLPLGEIASENDERLLRVFNNRDDGYYHDEETLKKFKKGASKYKTKSASLNDLYENPDYSREYFGYEAYKKPHKSIVVNTEKCNDLEDYVNNYCNLRADSTELYFEPHMMKNRINIYFGYGRETGYSYTVAGSNAYGQIKINSTDISKEDLYKVIFALKMNLDEAKQLLNFFGYTFSINKQNKLDNIVKQLISNEINGIAEIELIFKKNHLPSLFKKKKN